MNRFILWGLLILSFGACTEDNQLVFTPINIDTKDDVHDVITSSNGNLTVYSGYVWSHCAETLIDINGNKTQDTIADKALFDVNQSPIGLRIAVGVDGYLFSQQGQSSLWEFHRLSHWDILHTIQLKNKGFLASGGKAFERGYIYHINENMSLDTVLYFGHEISDIAQVSENTWLSCGWGHIQRSTDNGYTWQTLSPDGDFFVDVHFVNATQGYTIGINGTLLMTFDGGLNWEDISSKINAGFDAFRSIYHLSNGKLIITGSKGRIWLSGDQGKTWQKNNINDDRTITGLHQSIDGKIILFGTSGLLGRLDI